MNKKIDRIFDGGKPRVLDLFSGCGGLSLGFERANYEIWAGIEIDPFAAASHAINFHGLPVPKSRQDCLSLSKDILELSPSDLVSLERAAPDVVDVLIGGPPCQAYARVGRAKLRQVDEHPAAYRQDPRGNLYLRYLHYVRKLKPLAILMENVPDALNYGGHNIAEETAEVLDDLGYDCKYTLLNAVHYGVPQYRERMFLIAYHRSLKAKIVFPAPQHVHDLPRGYASSRNVALRNVELDMELGLVTRFVNPPAPAPDARKAVTAEEALVDLPPIFGHLSGKIGKGARNLFGEERYSGKAMGWFAGLMRNWPLHQCNGHVTAHVIRSLPRDYKLFRRLPHGAEYPEAYDLANELFARYFSMLKGTRREIECDSQEFLEAYNQFVPPYDPGKFPNKWRKLEPDMPARTLMAHLGKDSYSHIHYDSRQARTISVREAARLQSFPDGFRFAGAMNAAFKQIGNAVPPLLSWHLAEQIKKDAFRLSF